MKPKPPDLKNSLRYLRRDSHIGPLIKKYGNVVKPYWRSRNAFESLAQSIIYQQLSGKAAGTILKRFVGLFPGKKFPTPDNVLKISIVKLRSAGLSNQKASYLKDLALKFKERAVSPKNFHRMSDAEIIEHLTQVKGIGVWTSHMFLMFTLFRPDILPTGDLGIQKGFQKLHGLKKLPSPQYMERLAKNWEGHRTVASFYLWKIVDED